MSRSRPSESTDGHIFHTWLSHQFHPPSPSPSSDFPAVAAKDETLFCPICRAWHDLTGRWGVDWYQSPGRQTGDGGGLEENWDVDLGSIYPPLPPSLPGFHLSHLDYCSCHSRAHMVRVRSQYVWRLTLNGWCTRRRHKGLQWRRGVMQRGSRWSCAGQRDWGGCFKKVICHRLPG